MNTTGQLLASIARRKPWSESRIARELGVSRQAIGEMRTGQQCFRRSTRTPGIWTTDNRGFFGYNPGRTDDGDAAGHYTNSFGGISSSCPGAAGVCALVIARNPELRWDQVKDVLRGSSDRIDPNRGRYDRDGHSHKYGYGRLNAKRAVELAAPETPAVQTVVHRRNRVVPIRDFRTARLRVEVPETSRLHDLVVHVDIEHTWIGDLTVRLRPPAGTGVAPVVLHSRTGRDTRNIRRAYATTDVLALAALVGKLHYRDTHNPNGFDEEILPMHVHEGVGWTSALLRGRLPASPTNAHFARDVGWGRSDYTEYDRAIGAAACRWLREESPKHSAKPWVLFVSFVSTPCGRSSRGSIEFRPG